MQKTYDHKRWQEAYRKEREMEEAFHLACQGKVRVGTFA